ncbi:MAG: hypothetical protein C0605_09235 [Hyphomicrobiales bacterium]|nr:MAG: hypothetical protein C0605_09235 [Hyphomicrobiales bacterium]
MNRSLTPIAVPLAAALLWLGLTAGAQAYSGEVLRVCGLDPYGDNFLSLRSCGSSRCREIGRLGPGTQVLTLEPYGRWREVLLQAYRGDNNFSGGRGWVFGKYLCR